MSKSSSVPSVPDMENLTILRVDFIALRYLGQIAGVLLPGWFFFMIFSHLRCCLPLTKALICKHLVNLALLILNLLIHVELALNFLLDVSERWVGRVVDGCSMRINWPFAGRVRLVDLRNDRGMRLLHGFQMNRFAKIVWAIGVDL